MIFIKSFIPLNAVYITLLTELEDAIVQNSADTLIIILFEHIDNTIHYIGHEFLYSDSELPYSAIEENSIVKVMTLASFLQLLKSEGEYCPETGDIVLFSKRKICLLFMRHIPQRLKHDMQEYGSHAMAAISAEESGNSLYYKDYRVLDSDESSIDPLISLDYLKENEFITKMTLSSLEKFYYKFYLSSRLH